MPLGRAYCRDGATSRLSHGNDLRPGEVFIPGRRIASAEQITAIFPNYATALAAKVAKIKQMRSGRVTPLPIVGV